MSVVIQVCAWCEAEGRRTVLGFEHIGDGEAEVRISHGMCVPHRETFLDGTTQDPDKEERRCAS